MSRKENKGINPLLLKFGVALAVSFAGFLFSRLRSKSTRPSLPPPPSSPSDANKQVVHCRTEISDDVHTTPRTPISEAQDKPFLRVRIDNNSSNSSPSTRSSDRERFLLPEFNELIKGFDMSSSMLQETETPISIEGPPKTNHVERDEYEQEIQKLNSMVSDLRESERSLEMQLLEYYGLKEQETSVKELQNRLKINNVEAKVFKLKIEALQGENKRLKYQVVDYAKVVTELEDAKAKIKELKKKLRSDAEERKEQILKLKKRVMMMKLQEHDHSHMDGSNETVDPDLLENLQRLQDLESEREELLKSKNELQRENSELAHRLESTQILATSMLEDREVGELHNEVIRLREENENLTQEVERLQSDRCADAEALVYLKWVNACLRYELRNYQPPPGKTVARDLSKTLSPTSEAKAKQLILEYANRTEEKDVIEFEYDQWSSSQSYQTDSGDHDEASFDALSCNKAQHSMKLKFFDKLRRLVTGKDKDKDKDDHTTTITSRNKKASALLKSQSVEACGKVYSYLGPRRNSISIPSQNSNRSSAEPEVGAFTRVSAEDAKETKIMRMNRSSSASSSHSCKRFVLGGSVSPLDSQVEKGGVEPDLAGYAEALKESSWTKKTHRKSASYSAF